jgi:hypothetical protein
VPVKVIVPSVTPSSTNVNVLSTYSRNLTSIAMSSAIAFVRKSKRGQTDSDEEEFNGKNDFNDSWMENWRHFSQSNG